MAWLKILKIVKFIWANRELIASWLSFLAGVISLLKSGSEETASEKEIVVKLMKSSAEQFEDKADYYVAMMRYMSAELRCKSQEAVIWKEQMEKLGNGLVV